MQPPDPVAAMVQALQQPKQPMTQVAGDVVPLPIAPTFASPGMLNANSSAPSTMIHDYNRLMGALRASQAARAGKILPSAPVLMGPGALP